MAGDYTGRHRPGAVEPDRVQARAAERTQALSPAEPAPAGLSSAPAPAPSDAAPPRPLSRRGVQRELAAKRRAAARRTAARRAPAAVAASGVAAFALVTTSDQHSAFASTGRVMAGPGLLASDELYEASTISPGVRAEEADAKITTERAQIAELAARVAAKEQAAREAARKAEAARTAALNNARVNPQAAAAALLSRFGWGQSQMSCLIPLWQNESGWKYTAANPSSGAYGIPQALPGSKMGTVASDWQTNPVTQITWGLSYIQRSYGSPCNAWYAWQNRSPHWY